MEQHIIPQKLRGTVTVPPSKSQAHRAVIATALAAGDSVLTNLALSEDIRATVQAMANFGQLSLSGDRLTVRGGLSSALPEELVFDCNESGSTLRFLIPLALTTGKKSRFTGRGRLLSRPLEPYFELCRQDHIRFEQTEDALLFEGQLAGGLYRLPGNISSQFITGLLFALPRLSTDSTLELTTALESAGYIDMTLDILRRFGITIRRPNGRRFEIPGGQTYQPCSMTIEGDYSQAAFYLCANAMGSCVDVQGLSADSCQGDREIVSIIRRFSVPLRGITIDVRQVPDLAPVLAVLATQADGTTHMINAGRLRMKESDRLHTVADMLTRFGAHVAEGADCLTIHGKTPLRGCTIDSHNDHRIAMAAAIAATVAEGPVTICGSECVAKSYGNFWQDYNKLAL